MPRWDEDAYGDYPFNVMPWSENLFGTNFQRLSELRLLLSLKGDVNILENILNLDSYLVRGRSPPNKPSRGLLASIRRTKASVGGQVVGIGTSRQLAEIRLAA